MSIESYVSRFSPIPGGDDHLRFRCPLCKDHANRFYVRVRDRGRRRRGACCCFNCSFSAKEFVRFIAAVEGCSPEEAALILGGDSSSILKPAGVYDLFLSGEEEQTSSPFSWVIPKEFKKIALPGSADYESSPYAKKAHTYLRGRGISNKSMRRYDLRYCKSAGRYFGMVIMPVFEDGKPVYFCTRAYTDNYVKKTINPTLEELGGVGKSDVVFGLDRAADKRFCVITEGPFDAMTLGDYGVAILGKVLSQKQRDKLLSCKFKRIYIMLDADAKDAAASMCKSLSGWVPSVVVPMDDTEKDVNNIGAVAAWDKIKSISMHAYSTSALYSLAGMMV